MNKRPSIAEFNELSAKALQLETDLRECRLALCDANAQKERFERDWRSAKTTSEHYQRNAAELEREWNYLNQLLDNLPDVPSAKVEGEHISTFNRVVLWLISKK